MNLNMKFIYLWIDEIKKIILRFPLTFIITILWTIYSIYLVEINSNQNNNTLMKILLILSMAYPLGIAIELFTETYLKKKYLNIFIKISTIVFLILYYFIMPDDIFKTNFHHLIRSQLIFLSFCLSITFIPFLKNKNLFAFWEYNKTIFTNFIANIFYTGILISGLSLALISLEIFFNIKIKSNIYLDLNLAILGIFSSCFFLYSIPNNINNFIEEKVDFPKWLAFGCKYILLTIFLIYGVILYLYVIKIIITQNWPKNWSSYFILWFFTVGNLLLLAIYPIKEKENWAKIFYKFYFYASFPLILMLFAAIIIRIRQYGITEERYIVILCAFWLLFLSLYFILSNKKDIKIIPISIFLILILFSFGPWGIFSVSKRSQTKILTKLLIKNNLLENSLLKKTEKMIPYNDNKQICSILIYLSKNYNLNSLDKFFPEDLKKILADKSKNNEYTNDVNKITYYMGIKYIPERYLEYEKMNENFTISNKNKNIINISGYDYFVNNFYFNECISEFEIDKKNYTIKSINNNNEIIITEDDKREIIKINLFDFYEKIKNDYHKFGDNFDTDKLSITAENDLIKVKIIFHNLTFFENKFTSGYSYILIKKK